MIQRTLSRSLVNRDGLVTKAFCMNVTLDMGIECEGESARMEDRRRPRSRAFIIARKEFTYTDKSRSVKRKEK
jgi:hypothetical protein